MIRPADPWRAVPDDDPDPRAWVACADWLDAARALPARSVNFLYADPPFNTGTRRTGRHGAYGDVWPDLDAYLAWLGERLDAALPCLRRDGLVLLHVDWRTAHRVRVLLDDHLGPDRFVNHIVWVYGLGGSSPRRFARKHDDLLLYCLDPDEYHFDPPRVPATSRRMHGETKKATDVISIPAINNMAGERTGYPTQKPLELLELLIGACCPPGGVVLDPCCGSGTTPLAAIRTGRLGLGSDASPEAAELTARRLAEHARAGEAGRGTPVGR